MAMFMAWCVTDWPMPRCASIGAVWSSCAPEFGVRSVVDRFAQIEPKVLFATDGYFYNGKSIDSLPAVRAIADDIWGRK